MPLKRVLKALAACAILTSASSGARAASFSVIYDFKGRHDGCYPDASATDGGRSLTLTSTGLLYGTTELGGEFGLGTVFKINLQTGRETVLHSFGGSTDGAKPSPVLAMDYGALYGTTRAGGASDLGTIYKIDRNNDQETVLYSFTGKTDGSAPGNSLTLYRGLLYGTTLDGGSANYGTVFSFGPRAGIFTTAFSFSGPNGDEPDGVISFGPSGEIYGATLGGSQFGLLYQLNPRKHVETPLYNFGDSANGQNPNGVILSASSGILFGTTFTGGQYGFGTLFRANPTKRTVTTLHDFASTTDGGNPTSLPIIGPTGILYGTTTANSGDLGTVYELRPSGVFSVLYTFENTGATSPEPDGQLVMDATGTLYGAAGIGGAHGCGIIYKISS
jgi:uncharacterized repeat protein (TIGR03803 family)